MNIVDQIRIFNNVTVRLRGLQFPRDYDELSAILEKRVVGVLRESEHEADRLAAETVSNKFGQKEFRSLTSDLRYCASRWESRAMDTVRAWVPTPENDTGAVFELARRDLAYADLLRAMATHFNELTQT